MIDLRSDVVNSPGKFRRSLLVPIALRGQTTGQSAFALFLVAVFTVILFAARVYNTPVLATGVAMPGIIVIVGFLFAARYAIIEQVGSTHVLLTAIEIPLLLGLFSSSPARVVGACIIGTSLSWLLQHRVAMFRFLTNFTLTVFEAVIIVTAFHAIATDSNVRRTATWFVAFTVVLTSRIIRTLLELLIVRLGGATFTRRNAVGTVLVTIASSVCMTSLGLVAVIVATQSRLAELLVLAVVALPVLVYRGFVLLREQFSRLYLLQEFTAPAREPLDQQQMIQLAINRARAILRAEGAELTITSGQLAVRESCGTADSGATLPAPGDLLWERLFARGSVISIGPQEKDPELVSYLRPFGVMQLLAVPLVQNGERIGVLCVRDRAQGTPPFSTQDAALFATMADHLSAVLHGFRLAEHLHAASDEYARLATIDALTGLPNRGALAQQIGGFCDSLEPSATTSAALITLDLNRFKEVNSALGHETGDALIVGIADKVRMAVPRNALVARLGGDELAVLVDHIADEHEALAMAIRVQTAVRTEQVVADLLLQVDCAIGVVLIPDHGRDHGTLMRRADVAMYVAKQSPEGAIELFDLSKEEKSSRQAALVRDLRTAIETNALTVHYQPKADLSTGVVVGVEALVRWDHVDHGFIPPDEFVGLAEHAGLIGKLTDLVLRQALRQCRVWQDAGLGVQLAVNLSARSLREPNLAGSIEAFLVAAGVSARQLTLEITEGEYVHDGPLARQALRDLHALGVKVSIDDFGTGYSSLSYLSRLTADEVKIDKSFITNVSTDESSAAIVRAVVELARELKLKVVAEGVEDQVTWDCLSRMGVDTVQGYFLSRPLSGEKLGMWMWERRRSEFSPLGTAPISAVGG
jgi:diguanylate cyclase (GGDEF)-like protein